MQFNSVLDYINVYEAGKPIELVVREFGIEPDKIIKLASNENPYGCSPKVSEAINKHSSEVYLYPDDSMYSLKSSLSKHLGISKKELIIGAGSDQVIEMAIRAKSNSSQPILMNSITFAMYSIYAAQLGVEVIRTTAREHDLDEFYALYAEKKPSIIFLCTPNNPTGDAIKVDKLLEFIAKIDRNTLVVVDGAYMEYAAQKDEDFAINARELVKSFEHVLYLGTFSKSYGLGGMRVGYGVAKEEIIEALYKLRPPFNVTTLSLVAATAALKDEEFVEKSISKNFEQMKLFEEFAKNYGLEYINSFTNFITLILPQTMNSTEISDTLLKDGIIIRNLASYSMNALRITIGTSKQNQKFFKQMKKILG